MGCRQAAPNRAGIDPWLRSRWQQEHTEVAIDMAVVDGLADADRTLEGSHPADRALGDCPTDVAQEIPHLGVIVGKGCATSGGPWALYVAPGTGNVGTAAALATFTRLDSAA